MGARNPPIIDQTSTAPSSTVTSLTTHDTNLIVIEANVDPTTPEEITLEPSTTVGYVGYQDDEREIETMENNFSSDIESLPTIGKIYIYLHRMN